MTVSDIPTLNAALNATATVLITAGFIFIKQGKRDLHRAWIAGFALSFDEALVSRDTDYGKVVAAGLPLRWLRF